jgi:hypothetical protein
LEYISPANLIELCFTFFKVVTKISKGCWKALTVAHGQPEKEAVTQLEKFTLFFLRSSLIIKRKQTLIEQASLLAKRVKCNLKAT